jgi:hypothetical protein
VFDQWYIEKATPATPSVTTVAVKARRRRLGEERKPLTPTNDTCVLAPGPELRGVHCAAVRGDVGNEPRLLSPVPTGFNSMKNACESVALCGLAKT